MEVQRTVACCVPSWLKLRPFLFLGVALGARPLVKPFPMDTSGVTGLEADLSRSLGPQTSPTSRRSDPSHGLRLMFRRSRAAPTEPKPKRSMTIKP